MAEHYYTKEPTSEHKPATVEFSYRGQALTFDTDSGVFSRTELDRGTRILLDALPGELSGRCLDMGCGYGAIGVAVKKRFPNVDMTMADVNERAVLLAKGNAEKNRADCEVITSDGFSALMGREFDIVLINPPIRAGKAVIYRMFSDAAAALSSGGEMYIVIRKQQGAPSALNYLRTVFLSAEVIEREGGYWVIRCGKESEHA